MATEPAFMVYRHGDSELWGISGFGEGSHSVGFPSQDSAHHMAYVLNLVTDQFTGPDGEVTSDGWEVLDWINRTANNPPGILLD